MCCEKNVNKNFSLWQQIKAVLLLITSTYLLKMNSVLCNQGPMALINYMETHLKHTKPDIALLSEEKVEIMVHNYTFVIISSLFCFIIHVLS